MILLGMSLIIYCIIHSILADGGLFKKIYYQWWYRFFYVFQSIILFIPILYFYISTVPIIFYSVSMNVRIIMIFIQVISIIFSVYASKSYDNEAFLGILQVKNRFRNKTMEFKDDIPLKILGALKYVRHPYYFSGLVFIWFRPLYTKDLLVNIILTIYIFIGTLNEERKLLNQFGSEYIKYKEQVPMLFPKIWRIY